MKDFKITLHKHDKQFIDLDKTFGKLHGHGVLRLKNFMEVMNEARMEGAIETLKKWSDIGHETGVDKQSPEELQESFREAAEKIVLRIQAKDKLS